MKNLSFLEMNPSNPRKNQTQIIIQQELSQIIRELNNSFETSPLTFSEDDSQNNDFRFSGITTSINPISPRNSITETNFVKLINPPNKKSHSFATQEISFFSITNDLTEITVPTTDIIVNGLEISFIRRLVELYPEVKRQSAKFLRIPTDIVPEEIISCDVRLNPVEMITFCYENFPKLEDGFSCELFSDSTKVESSFSFEDFQPDYECNLWEFLIVANATGFRKISLDDDGVIMNELRSLAAKVVVRSNDTQKSNISVLKNNDLPILPILGIGSEETVRLPYLYQEQLDLFINKVKTLLVDETSSEKKKRERLQESESIIKRANAFKRIKDANPEWTLDKVAMEYNISMYEKIKDGDRVEFDKEASGTTVRNAYRTNGWKWDRGVRTR